jgi:hypothetical protein
MRKLTQKRLVLSKETLRDLEDPHLGLAAGGNPTQYPPSCQHTICTTACSNCTA